MADAVTITFAPSGSAVSVPRGTSVLEAARVAGLPLPSTCGGQGTCGDCAVRVVSGEVDPPVGTEAASLLSAPSGVRLACMLRPESDVTVRPVAPVAVPSASLERATPSSLRAVAAAIDLGTTTIAVSLLDAEGREIARGTSANPQRTFGGDVASRIAAALAGEGRELRDLAMRGIAAALEDALADVAGVTRVAVACNTAMAHLALGAEVSGLAAHPYAGVLSTTTRTTAGGLGLDALPPEAGVVFLPPMAAFVGGDATAGVLATGIDRARDVRVLLDLGTNAEVVVAASGELTVASAAAGPAFEAAGLACGSPAQPGAVRDARVADGGIALDVVGGGPAESLCGSGALALVGALLDAGHLDATGRLIPEGPLHRRFHRRGAVLALQVAGGSGGPGDVYITQLDVRELQLAKAAVATALELTLARAGVSWTDVAEIIVAGAFGAGVDAGLLRRLGVVPPAAEALVAPAGDTALAGAALVAHDEELEGRAEDLATRSHGVDLAADPAFRHTFIARTSFGEQV